MESLLGIMKIQSLTLQVSREIIKQNSHSPKLLTTLMKTLYLAMQKLALLSLTVPLMIEKLSLLEVRLPAGTCIKWEIKANRHPHNNSN